MKWQKQNKERRGRIQDKRTDMDEQEYRQKLNELERRQDDLRREKRRKKEAEDIYWDIKGHIRELIKTLPEHWEAPEYDRTIECFEEDLFCSFRRIEQEFEEEEIRIEKERNILIIEEDTCRYEYQKQVIQEENQ